MQRVLPAYRIQLFEALREQARQDGHSFELWVSPAPTTFARRGTESHLSWARSLAVKALPAWLGGLEYQLLPWRLVLAADVVIVPDNVRCVSNIMVLLSRRLLGKPVLTWGHGANFQSDGKLRWLVSLRYRLLRIADGNLVYTQACVEPLQAAGFDLGRIGVIENAVEDTLAKGLHDKHPEVLAFRQTHGLGNAPCVVLLGSWYARKRPELITEIGLALRQQIPQARVLVIGAGDGLTVLAAQAPQLPWLTLLGSLHDRKKFVALAASRCLVVSGIAGLNLLDAMAVGLPVVLPQRADHSPEVSYVVDSVNGLVVPDEVARLAEACSRLILDSSLHARLSKGARQTSGVNTIQAMADNMLRYAVNQFDNGPVVFIYQRMLPYHQARFAAVSEALKNLGRVCLALEVASFDRVYGRLAVASPVFTEGQSTILCLFPDKDYLNLTPQQVSGAVFSALLNLEPSVVFAPAPAFAEGAGALHYKVRHGGRLIMMDDAWGITDQSSLLTRCVKRLFYGYVDGGFFPDRLHGDYFSALNIPNERQRYPVDVVGPILEDSSLVKNAVNTISEPYLLFVGRLTQRKGLEVLLRAIAGLTPAVHLVVIGDGPQRDVLLALASELRLADHVHWLGRLSNNEARLWMVKAQALLVPSEFEQWGLVANEAWLATTLVLGSDTVGAIKATYKEEMHWMMVPAGDIASWQQVIARLLKMLPDERAALIDATKRLATKYSLAAHTKSALELVNIPKRALPLAPVGWLARAWKGRVTVW